MTTPNIVATGYLANSTDFNRSKVDRSGALRTESFSITIPSGTASGAIIGLVPFRKGAKFVCHASGLNITDVDTGTTVTASVGYVYDDNVTYTNAPAAFLSASTVPQTGGTLPLNGLATCYNFVAAADGWIALTVGGSATTAAGTLVGQITLTYDA